MENKSNEEWAELVRAQVAVIDGLRLEPATRQPAAPAAPVVTVDTPEFEKVADEYRASFEFGYSVMSRDYAALVAYIDAHTARAVAAARATHHATCEQYIAERDAYRRERDAAMKIVDAVRRDNDPAFAHLLADLDRAAQPVAGELPLLSDEQLDRIARNYFVEPYGQEQVKNAIHDAFLECRAAQPVQQPAAVVGQEPVYSYRMKWADGTYSNWSDCTQAHHEHLAKWPDQDGFQLRILYTTPAPAAGVQGDPKCHRCVGNSNTHADFCPLKAATVQPDSGRDAALSVAVLRDCLQDARYAFSKILGYVDTGTPRKICAEQMQAIDADLAKSLQLAAHPANGAQAGHQAPFMYAIKGPDGSAYIDENCVSATEGGLYFEVNGLNDSPDAGYSIVPVFLAATPQKKEG